MLDRFKEDVQRWVIPQQIADPSLVTFATTLKLLWLHKPLRAMLWLRMGTWCVRRRIPLTTSLTMMILYYFHGLEISPTVDIGGGLYIAHPQGTVLSAERIGRNCTIIHNVTVGMRNEWAFPVIGDEVFIGAGARVLGEIDIGDGAKIGANAVVINDVPAGATVVGIPAKVIALDEKYSA